MNQRPPQQLTAQDLAQFESFGVSDSTSASQQPAQQPPLPQQASRNPFLAPQPHHNAQDDLAQLSMAPSAKAQPQQQPPLAGPVTAPAPFSDPPLASGLDAAAAAPPAVAQPAPAPPSGSQPTPAMSHAARSSPEPKAWPTKDVMFRGQERKIIMQNENGPCSLIAIANLLLLRGNIMLTPPDRPLVSYDYLSSLIAEYLLTQPSTTGGSSGATGGGDALERALSLLPQTRHGLNLNPSFLSNDAFHSSDGGSQSLELFELLGIKLYHGFLPDMSAPNSYELLTRAGSYDAAVDAVVQGDTLASRFFREGLGEQGSLRELAKRGGAAVVESTGWGTSAERKELADALEISQFLDANASQLTYPGLFALSSLPEGTLATLFRFNHLSVLYRPSTADISTDTRAPPSLLTLITDESLIDEELAVWETLADVDGSGSGEIFDGRLRPRRIEQRAAQAPAFNQAGEGNEDADFALALQLHSEERDRAERRQQRDYQRRRGHAPGSSRDPTSEARIQQQQQQQQQKRHTGSGNLFSALKGKKQQAPSAAYASAQQGAADDLAPTSEGSGRYDGGKTKKGCVVM